MPGQIIVTIISYILFYSMIFTMLLFLWKIYRQNKQTQQKQVEDLQKALVDVACKSAETARKLADTESK